MPYYFAYGLNMSRARLEVRVGEVSDRGCALLSGYRHRFDKLGADGTGKGNLERAAGERVYGVLYELADEQLEVLAVAEGGYRRVAETVVEPTGEEVEAVVFVALAPRAGLMPSAAYLEHYRLGMREHALPQDYCERTLAAVGHRGDTS